MEDEWITIEPDSEVALDEKRLYTNADPKKPDRRQGNQCGHAST
jgi:hypothetical protein